MARMTVDELKGMMDNGHDVFVVDLRGALDHEADPFTIPGALRMTAEEIEKRHSDIPRHRDVILFCACPNEATAAQMALLLRRNGITKVRPLAGGTTPGGNGTFRLRRTLWSPPPVFWPSEPGCPEDRTLRTIQPESWFSLTIEVP